MCRKVISFHDPGDKLHKLARVIQSKTSQDLYRLLISHWDNPRELVPGYQQPRLAHSDTQNWPPEFKLLERMMYLDLVTYLPDDILVKVDRASMAVSLESRAPFLDHRVVELAWRMPIAWKYKNGKTKWILRKLLGKYVPEKLFDRPKMGFGVPMDSWLRGPLREWAEALLNRKRLESEGLLSAEPVQRTWQEHLSGQRNWQYLLWDILAFQAWLEAQRC